LEGADCCFGRQIRLIPMRGEMPGSMQSEHAELGQRVSRTQGNRRIRYGRP